MMERLLCLLLGHVERKKGETVLLRLRKRVEDGMTVSWSDALMGKVGVTATKVFRVVDVYRCKRCRGLYWEEWEDVE